MLVNKIRTKIVLTLLLITLLPVLPLYFLLKNFLAQSLEVGFNKKVEAALEDATGQTRRLYSKYKEETLLLAEKYASNPKVLKFYFNENMVNPPLDEIDSTTTVILFDHNGKVKFKANQNLPIPLQAQEIAQILHHKEPGVLKTEVSSITAFAPVLEGRQYRGFVLVHSKLPQDFVKESRSIVEVHQMFKTLGWAREDIQRSFLMAFFVVYAPFALFSILMGYLFSRKITAPILKLVEGTRKVAAGNWDYRVEVKSRDEVGQLVQAFNQMVHQIKQKQDQIISLEKMAAWREIARVLAHEIKNPLTPIQLTVQQMRDKYEGQDPHYKHLLAECTEIVTEEIENLRKLVREFSEFARMPQLEKRPGNLNDLVVEVGKLYQEKNLRVQTDPSIPELNFDYEKMRRVLINLIENALDSLPRSNSGEVWVKTFCEESCLVLEVGDTGKGIPQEDRDKIFEPYFSTKKSGMGLGLAVVKRIVEEHGWQIDFESEVNGGSRFFIKIPGS